MEFIVVWNYYFVESAVSTQKTWVPYKELSVFFFFTKHMFTRLALKTKATA